MAGIGAAALLVTAACSGDAGDEETTEPEATETPAVEEDVTIRFSWWGNEERAAKTNAAVEAFMAANPHITVETDSVDFNSYFDRLATSVAADDEPDVITMGGAYPREYGARGVLLDLAEVEDVLGTAAYDEAALANGFFEGAQYGIPTGVNSFGVIANPVVFEAAGVDLPDDDTWDWADFAEIATEISANSPEGTFGAEDPTAPDVMDLYADQHTGSGLYTEDGGLAITADTVAEWLEYTFGLMESGATPSAALTAELSGQPNPEQTLLGRGLAGMKFAWTNQLTAYSGASGAELVMLRAPGETTEEEPGQWLQASQLYTISARSEHPEAAAALVAFLTQSTEAADSIGSDRGVPAVQAVREYLLPSLTPVSQIEFDYISRVSELIDGEFVIGPTGSTESVGIMTRLNQAVLFGQLTPQDAGAQFVSEMTAAISQ